MRRADQSARAEQRILLGRFLGEHIERCARDVPGFEAFLERSFIDQSAAGAIDDAHPGPGPGERLSAEDTARLVGERRVQRDEVGAGEQVVQLDLLDAELDRALWREERVVGDDLHLQAVSSVGDDRADVAASDEAERLAGELDAEEPVLLPLPACVD